MTNPKEECNQSGKDPLVIEALLKQYDLLRSEIVRCIYLEHIAILALYTFLGVTIATVVKEVIGADVSTAPVLSDILGITTISESEKLLLFLFILILLQIPVCGFGSLFLKEQIRNRRACSFLKAIEYLISKKLGEIGIYWENFITSPLIAKKTKIKDYLTSRIPLNRQYYINRLLSVGLPVFLPNFLITCVIAIGLYNTCGGVRWIFWPFLAIAVIKVLTMRLPVSLSKISPIISFMSSPLVYVPLIAAWALHEEDNPFFVILFAFSFAITFSWALTIMYQTFSPLVKEKTPSRERIIEWLQDEIDRMTHTVVVLEGCLGDWSKKSYIEKLAERARKNKIMLYAVDTRDIQDDEVKSEFYETPVKFLNKKADRDRYDEITNVDLVFIVTPPDFHCEIAEHWLQEGKLKKDGKLFVEKPLDSSEKRIGNLKKKYKVKDKIIVIDHYIPKILPLIEKLKEKKEKCGKIENIEFNILESEPILESRKKTLDEGLILDIYPHVLAVFIKVAQICNKFRLDASNVEILKVKSGKYKSAPITGETFAKIVVKTDGITLESCIGKAVGARDRKFLKIFFEKGPVTVNFTKGAFSIKIKNERDINKPLQKNPISMLLDDIIDRELDKKEILNKALNFKDGFEIVKIISKIRKRAGKPVEYEKSSSRDGILEKFKKMTRKAKQS